MTKIKPDEKILEKKIKDSRGRPIKCKYCKSKFQLFGEEKIIWKQNKYICPICGELYCILPPTEKELRILQEKYIKNNRDKKIFDEIITIVYSYTESLIKKHYSNRLNFEGSLHYYTHNTVSRFIEYYLKDDEFTVDVSFAGLLMHKIKEAIFNKKEHATAGISLDFQFEDGNKVEYEDVNRSVIDVVEENEFKKNLCKQLVELVFKIEQYCSCKQENYIRLINTLSYIQNGNKYFDKFFQLYGSNGKLVTLKTLDAIKEQLMCCEEY